MKSWPRLQLSLLILILAWLVLINLTGGYPALFNTPTGTVAETRPPEPLAWLPEGIEVGDRARVEQLLLGSGRGTGMKAVTTESTGLDLFFPHVADGLDAASDLRITASIVVIGTGVQTYTDPRGRDSDAELFFFKEDGTPMEVSIGGVTASRFPFKVKVGETRRLRTDGTGPIKVGWAKLRVTQPVGATLTFAISRAGGQLDSEVGVDRARPSTELAIFAEFSASSNTAMAFLNTDATASNRVDMTLYDLEGKQFATASETLQPGGKRAQFLTERFPALAGRTSFQGLLVLKGQKPLGVLTLRSRGRHLTSLPAVRKLTPADPAVNLYFYRVGSGVIGGIRYQTSFILMNHSDGPVNATLDLFQDDGTPLVVRIGNQQASTFSFSLKPKGASLVTTSDTGAAKTGWARLKPDKALEATATFTLLQAGAGPAAAPLAAGDFLAEVGVDSTTPYKRPKIFADTIVDRNTAIALSNPTDQEIVYSMSLVDKNGNLVKFISSQKLGPRAHLAKFVTEFFKDVVPAPGKPHDINEFEGRVDVFCESPGCVTGTLRLAGPFLTSLPVLLQSHGFKPTTTIELHSELGGSSPSGAFKIQQFDDDMVLKQVEVSLPEVGFDNTLFKDPAGGVVTYGDTGEGNAALTLGKVASIENNGTVRLDLQQYNLDRNTFRQAVLTDSGKMTLSGNATSGFKAVVEFPAQPATFIGNDFFFQVFLPPTVLKLPAGGTTIRAETKLISASTKLFEDAPLQEINRQNLVLPNFPAGAPQILYLNPFQGRAQAPLFLLGKNLSASTNQIQVLFTGLNGQDVPGEIVGRDGDRLLIDIPDGIKTGPVKLRQNNQDSNPYTFRVVFDPQEQFAITPLTNNTAVNLKASLKQKKGELAFLNWKIEIDQATLKLTGWTANQVVGTGNLTGSSAPYDLKVESVASGHLILMLVQRGFSSADARFKLSNRGGGGVLIENLVTSESQVPLFNTQDVALEWETTVPLLQLPAGAGKTLTANSTRTSVRNGMHPENKYSTFSQRTFVTQ